MPSFRLNITPLVPSGTRLPVVNELRGLALLLVLCYHGGAVLNIPNVLHGELGVDVFLMVSGFTLALASADLSARQFFQRRFRRIFPAYWLALGLFLGLHWQLLGRTYPAGDIGLHVLGLHGFGPIDSFVSINDSFWFITMIVSAYGVFFALRRHLDDFSLVVAVGALLTTVACVGYMEAGHFGGLIHLGLRIPSFFLGLLAGRLLGAGTMEIRVDLRLGLGLLCFFYLIFVRKVHFTTPVPALGIIATWIALHHLLVRIAVGRWLLAALAGLGLISYEVYLFHQPLIRDYNLLAQYAWLGHAPPTSTQLFEGILVALAVTVGLSLAVRWATTRWLGRPSANHPKD